MIGRIVRRFHPVGAALFAGGRVVGVRSVVVSVAGGGATGMRHAHALRGRPASWRPVRLRSGQACPTKKGERPAGIRLRRMPALHFGAGDGGLGGRR